jgi:RHS repeat-associated protein
MSGQTLSKGFVPLSGGATAVYNSNGLAYYRHAEWLGSVRFASTASRAMYYDGAYAPYGENYAETGTADRVFAGMGQDTVSSSSYPLYDAMYREYHPIWGRWLSPDPLGGGIASPQSLNRYGYVLNNAMTLIDPLGLQEKSNLKLQVEPTTADCTLNGIYMSCSVVNSLVGAGAAYPLPPPYRGWEPVSRGAQPDCPGCYYETWGPFRDAIWDPDKPESWGLWGIFWTQTSNTTWTFQSPLSFQETVETFKNVGIAPSPLDNKYNPFHGTDFNLRDFSPVCSVHVTLASDGTGSAHLDAFNPAYNVPSYPVSGEAVQGGMILLHEAFEVAPYLLHIPGANVICH